MTVPERRSHRRGARQAAFTDALGVPAAPAPGDRVTASAAGTPPLGATVELSEPGNLMLGLDERAPGVALIGCYAVIEPAYAMLRIFHYGPHAARVAADEPVWKAWMAERFPAPEPASAS